MTTRLVAVALVVGLAARLAFSLVYWHDKPLTHDEQEYLAYGINIARGAGFTRTLPGAFEGENTLAFSRAPLYPAFLAAVFRVTGVPAAMPIAVPSVVQVSQAVVGCVGVWLASLIATRMSGPATGAMAAWLTALWPSQVWLSAYALSEVLYAPLVFGAAYAAGAALDWHDRPASESPRLSPVIAGLVMGLAALTRSAALAFALVTAWLFWRRLSWRAAAAFVLATTCVVAPWTWRNALVHGRLIPVAADGGVNLWIGNHPYATGEGDMATNVPLKRAHRAVVSSHPGAGPEVLDEVFGREALRWIVESPMRVARLVAVKAFYAVVPIGPSYRAHSTMYAVASAVPYAVALPFAIAAVARWRRLTRPPVMLIALAGSAWLLMLVFFPHERYRLPAIDPVVIVLAAAWLTRPSWAPRPAWSAS